MPCPPPHSHTHPGRLQAEVELSQAAALVVGYDDHAPAAGGRAPRHAGQDAEAKQRLRQMAVPTRRDGDAARGDIIDEAFA